MTDTRSFFQTKADELRAGLKGSKVRPELKGLAMAFLEILDDCADEEALWEGGGHALLKQIAEEQEQERGEESAWT